MCGIIGYLGDREATPILMESLKRLEYRGYDSAGVAGLELPKSGAATRTIVTKSEAKVDTLIEKLNANMPTGKLGIGHTRWATHGKPTYINAHPHTDCHGKIFVVHNGIIENFAELKAELEAAGHEFPSETDTEVVPHLIEANYKGDFLAAGRAALKASTGAHALPLSLSDDGAVTFREFDVPDDQLKGITDVLLLGMGTSLHAAMMGEYVIEDWVGLPARAEDASEFRYRRPTVGDHTLNVVITQSGETADTLVALHQAKERGSLSVAVTNVIASSAARDADGAIYLHSGPEIGVASTKTLHAHMVSLYLLALRLASVKGRVSLERRQELVESLRDLPEKIRGILARDKEIQALADKYSKYRNFMYAGRGLGYPVALEGALKLKEISYIHAEGTSGGELKHGPIALLNEQFPVVAICTASATKDKMVSNVHEIVARNAPVLALVTEGDRSLDAIATDVFEMPEVEEAASAVLNTVMLQLFAYHVAVKLGKDVDQPRNLAKSVTVE